MWIVWIMPAGMPSISESVKANGDKYHVLSTCSHPFIMVMEGIGNRYPTAIAHVAMERNENGSPVMKNGAYVWREDWKDHKHRYILGEFEEEQPAFECALDFACLHRCLFLVVDRNNNTTRHCPTDEQLMKTHSVVEGTYSDIQGE